MSNIVIIGAQWGDEGKGKITNSLATCADMVVRFQGGSNAGHTVSVNGEPVVFHLLPSGISVPGVMCVLGAGVVIDPEALLREIHDVRGRGIEVGGNLAIDIGAHLVMPYHRAQEEAEEQSRGEGAIGTTRRGIGPAYADRYSREGLPIGLMASFDRFEAALRAVAARKNNLLTKLYGAPAIDVDDMVDRMRPVADTLSQHLTDTPTLVRDALASGGNVIFEGAQGTLLDVAFGTYPFVTSSHTTAAGVAPGTGVPPAMLGEIIGVAKAYVTRVGAGPFPTEQPDGDGAIIRERGKERGATTGRPRRCGWLDLVALKYSVDLNGIDRLIITKLDVLDTFGSIPVCVAYEIDGERTDAFPRTVTELARARPVYEELDGWKASTRDAREVEDLPPNAAGYVQRIEEITGVPVAAVSVGAAAHAIVEFAEIL
jgi:adenylosuccinate synthase